MTDATSKCTNCGGDGRIEQENTVVVCGRCVGTGREGLKIPMTPADISPEAVKRLVQIEENGGVCDLQFMELGHTLRALSSALTQSRAETAAAYERAAVIADSFMKVCLDQETRPEVLTGYGRGMYFCAAQFQKEIRALATPDQSAALAAIVADVAASCHEAGMREAAACCAVGPSDEWSDDTKSGYYAGALDCLQNILAAIPLKGETK